MLIKSESITKGHSLRVLPFGSPTATHPSTSLRGTPAGGAPRRTSPIRFLILIVLIFIQILLILVPTVHPAYAYLTDSAKTVANSFSAGTLDFRFLDGADNGVSSPLFDTTDLKPGDSVQRTIKIDKTGSLDFKYNLWVQKSGGDDDYCAALNLEAKKGTLTIFSGKLVDFNINNQTIGSSGRDEWDLKIGFSDDAESLQNKTCQFDFKVHVYQTNSNGSWGFRQDKTLGNDISAGVWPVVALSFADGNHKIAFGAKNISGFVKLAYKLTYDTDTLPQGDEGTVNLSGEDEFTREDKAATCTTGGTCTYYTGVKNVVLQIELEDAGHNITKLEKHL
jgi:hypothetical protein